MASGHIHRRRNHERQNEPVSKSHLQQPGVAGVLRHHDGSTTDEHQREGADEFGEEMLTHEMGDGRLEMTGAMIAGPIYPRHLACRRWPLASACALRAKH